MKRLVRKAVRPVKRLHRRFTTPVLSVVIPVYNGEDTIERAIRSVLNQGVPDVEVLVVDDVSTDETTKVVRRLALRDPRIRLIESPTNGGPGAARNIGVTKARGDYLAFVDADDRVLPNAYKRMLATIQETGSDFISGGYRRESSTGGHRPEVTKRVHASPHLATDLSKFQGVLEEPVLWNKIYRKDFWDSDVGPIPEDRNYEDQEPAIRAAARARAFDVAAYDVYAWALPEGRETRSQSKRTLEDLHSRSLVVEAVLDLAEAMPESAKHLMHSTILGRDLGMYIDEVPYAEDPYWDALVPLVTKVYESAPSEVISALTAAQRMAVHTVTHGSREDVETLLGALQEYGTYLPWRRDGETWRAQPQFLQELEVDVPPALLEATTSDFDLRVKTWSVEWLDGTHLQVHGYATMPGIRREDWIDRKLLLKNEEREVVWEANLDPMDDDWADVEIGDSWTTHAKSGFEAVVEIPEGTKGDLTLAVEVGVAGVDLTKDLKFPQRLVPPLLSPQTEGPFEATRADNGLLVIIPSDQTSLEDQEPTAPENAVKLDDVFVDGDLVHLKGSFAGSEETGAPFLQSSRQTIELPFKREGATWKATIDLEDEAVPSGGFFLRWGEKKSAVCATTDVVGGPPKRMIGDSRSVVLTAPKSQAALTLGPPTTNAERSRFGRQKLRSAIPPPLADTIVFDSFTGQSAGDNPLAIFEQLKDGRLHPKIFSALPKGIEDWKVFWSVSDGTQSVPEGAEPIYVGTERWFEVTRSAKALVTNNHLPAFFDKTTGQFWLQTWHGTPIKKLLFDAPRSTSSLSYRRLMTRQAPQWDLLLAQDKQAAQNISTGSKYSGETLIVEQPRNARFFEPGLREKVREELGIPEDELTILYAPTWRQDDVATGAPGDHLLDAGRLAGSTGATVLVRLHHMVPYTVGPSEKVLDVSGHPKVEDLMVASDALISDYSSIFFDYALLGRPMIAYQPDRTQYECKERGFYRPPEQLKRVQIVQTKERLQTLLQSWAADFQSNVKPVNAHQVDRSSFNRVALSHRGANRLAPENTMAAFREAVAAGATWIETDVDLLPDGTLILIHDDTLNRTTNRKGKIYNLTGESLHEVDAGSWFSEEHAGEPIPTIGEFIRLLNETSVNANIELKPHKGGPEGKQRLVQGVLKALEELHPDRQVIISSFAHDQLEMMAALAPDLTYVPIWGGKANPEAWIRKATELSAPFVHVQDKRLKESDVKQVADRGIGMNIWTVNDPSRAKALFDWGATGTFTDNHEMLTPGWEETL